MGLRQKQLFELLAVIVISLSFSSVVAAKDPYIGVEMGLGWIGIEDEDNSVEDRYFGAGLGMYIPDKKISVGLVQLNVRGNDCKHYKPYAKKYFRFKCGINGVLGAEFIIPE